MKRWKGYEHGVNLGGWLSQCDHSKERYETFIREEDVRRISSWGLDHAGPVVYSWDFGFTMITTIKKCN